ncbi:MAG: hypothetical protein JW881_12085 [Spirochaetales bacterium]|nr:hypothetical protein [Spirochaetales bacterium]
MPTKITFYPNGTWEGGARIPPVLQDMSDLSEWIRHFLKEYKNLGKLYAKYFTNDGELIGQEKANLVSALDGIIGGLLLLRRYVTLNTPLHFESLDNSYNFWFEIKLDTLNWRGRGKMSNRYTFNISSFAHWYGNTMIQKIQQVFRDYSRAMEDGKLTTEERNGLIRFIEVIIFDILVIEKVLIATDIHR